LLLTSRFYDRSSCRCRLPLFEIGLGLRCLQPLSKWRVATLRLPCQTAGTLEAPKGCSFRTYPFFLSGKNTSSRYRPNWLTPF